jgi:purine-binding chemotaxis protein CheW
MAEFLLFMVDTRQFGIPAARVDHVVRMVAITPVMAAPSPVAGIINYHGKILPVFSVRSRFSFPERPPVPEDLLIITGSLKRNAALIADTVLGVQELSEDLISTDEILPGITGIEGVVRTREGMILITDPDRFLLPEDDILLQNLMDPGRGES